MRSCKDHIQFNRSARESIIGITSQHIHALLLGSLDALVTLGNVTEHAKVNQCATRLIITMYSKDILTLLQKIALLSVQTDNHAINIIHNTCSGFLAIDIDFACIIMRENQIQVAFKLAGSQFHSTAYPYMVILLGPRGAYIIIIVRAEGTLACLPCRGVEVGLHPIV